MIPEIIEIDGEEIDVAELLLSAAESIELLAEYKEEEEKSEEELEILGQQRAMLRRLARGVGEYA